MVRAFEDPGTWTASYADRLRAITGVLRTGSPMAPAATATSWCSPPHLHVTGAQVTNSERPYTVSDGYAAHAMALPPVSYAAFGHIHRYQALPQASVTGCYAGSPIPLDFGEEHDDKGLPARRSRPRPAR